MAGDAPHSNAGVSDQDLSDQDLAANRGGAMRIFIFKFEASPELCAFNGDLAALTAAVQAVARRRRHRTRSGAAV